MRYVYYVDASHVVPDEPSQGWYVGTEGSVDIEGDRPHGPFDSKRAAIDYQADLMRRDKLMWLAEYEGKRWRPASDDATFQLEREGFVTTAYVGWGHNEVHLTPKGRAFLDINP